MYLVLVVVCLGGVHHGCAPLCLHSVLAGAVMVAIVLGCVCESSLCGWVCLGWCVIEGWAPWLCLLVHCAKVCILLLVGDGGLELVLVVVCLRGVHHGCAPLCHIGVLAGAMVVVCQCTGLCV
jgi:hypothetical protein